MIQQEIVKTPPTCPGYRSFRRGYKKLSWWKKLFVRNINAWFTNDGYSPTNSWRSYDYNTGERKNMIHVKVGDKIIFKKQ